MTVLRSVSRVLTIAAAVAVTGLATVSQAEAVPFTITSQLTGDFRTGNPDGLIVDVTITGDTTSNVTNWLVDLNSTAHPSARLGAFAFNVQTQWYQWVSFSNFTPGSWALTVDTGTNVPGSGGANFRFEMNDPPGNSNNVTNTQTLSFTATLNQLSAFDQVFGAAVWGPTNFLNAPLSTGGGIPSPGAQMGAHLQSLSTAGCRGCSDSGFASGNYSSSTPPTSSVPEPTTLLLMGLGLAAAGLRRVRK